jgi:prevent-host-death family protein
MTTRTVTVAEARSEFSMLLAQVELLNQRVVIARRGRPKAVLVSIDDLARLEALDQSADSAAGAERVASVLQQAGLLRPVSSDLIDRYVHLTAEERAAARKTLSERRFTPPHSVQNVADREPGPAGGAE